MILERIGILRSMRKRRVGVTARSRQNDGNQATGTLQFVTEMAAPLARIQNTSRHLRRKLQTECGWKHGDKGAGVNRQSAIRGKIARGKRRGGRAGDSALRAHEALPHTPPRGKPPETPGPLSLGIQVPERREFVKGSQAAQQRRALDKSPPF